MVHKKYIKINGKKYGPYYYESYRENGKIKKRYVKVSNEGQDKGLNIVLNKNIFKINSPYTVVYLAIVSFLIIATLFSYFSPFSFDNLDIGSELLLAPAGASHGSNNNANLSIWDDSDESGIEKRTYCKEATYRMENCILKGKSAMNAWNVYFYANYTDTLGNSINGVNGVCRIKYNIDGSFSDYENMVFNAVSLLWEYNRSFNYKGENSFEINCTSEYGNVSLENDFLIINTKPIIFQTGSGYIDFNFDGNMDTLQCKEDILCNYYLNSNVSEDDFNDVLNYGFMVNSNTTLTNFTLNSTTGGLAINVTLDQNCGAKKIELSVSDTESPTQSALLDVNILPVNDAPYFINLINKSINMTDLFDYKILAGDEEGNTPFKFNITFLSCNTAEWSTRMNVDCDLFNETQYSVNETAISIYFVPTRNDVGNYIVNFTVRDLNNNVLPYNSSYSQVVNFTILNLNVEPELKYVCDNERSAIEDSYFSCHINASDIDEVKNLTFTSDKKWFLDFKQAIVNSSTNYIGDIEINFTPGDKEVGNWQINLSVKDSYNPPGRDNLVFQFYVYNINDSVYLNDINDIAIYTSNNYYSFYINATDDDILIPDKAMFNEDLTFYSNYSCLNISFKEVVSGTNMTKALVELNPSDSLCFVAGNNYHVNISVVDKSGNIDSEVFIISVSGNNAPFWDNNTNTRQVLVEDRQVYLNLSNNVSDADHDVLVFSSIIHNVFPSFYLNSNTGEISFTPGDADVGEHIVNISVSDGATSVILSFNFTVYNLDDVPEIQKPLQGDGVLIDSNSNIIATEDNATTMFLFVKDDDLRIPSGQKGFYDEILTLALNISGPNTNLFYFNLPDFVSPDKDMFSSSFTPKKTDIGEYNVSANITDKMGNSTFIYFNFSVREINHAPVLMNLSNQTSAINQLFYYNIDAFDVEDGNDSEGKLQFSYEFLSGRDFIMGNWSIFNLTSGVLGYMFNESDGGRYHIKIYVNDSGRMQDSKDFWIFVVGFPVIYFPNPSVVFNLAEGENSPLTFMANDTLGNDLIYEFYLNEELVYNTSYYGNGTKIIWDYTPSYTSETYGLFSNLTLEVFVPGLNFLNFSRTWNVNISHKNAPIEFIKYIGDKEGIYGKNIELNLTNYFYDVDAFDPHYNQEVLFFINGNSTPSLIMHNVNNWFALFNSGVNAVELFNITARELNESGNVLSRAYSNNFEVRFKEPVVITVPVTVPSTGGGGGGSSQTPTEKPVSFKLILPGPVSARKGDTINLPLSLFNEGVLIFNDVSLSASIAKDGKILEAANISFDKDYFKILSPGMRENVSLIVQTGTTALGLYEITINASSLNPKYSDWGKIYVSVEEGMTITEKLIFTEEFVVENPECIELKERVDESRELLDSGNFKAAEKILDEAVNSCKNAISQKSLFSGNKIKVKFQDKIFVYLLIATIAAIFLGICYYVYQIMVFRRAVAKSAKENTNFSGVVFKKN